MTNTTKTTAADLVLDALEIARQKERAVQEAKDALRRAETEQQAANRHMVKLQLAATLAGYTENPTVWRELAINDRFPATHAIESIRMFCLETITLDLRVTITLRRDLKKFKYIVDVSGFERKLADRIGDITGGYNDYDYINRMYRENVGYGKYVDIKGDELQTKFTSEEAAEAHAKKWMQRMEADSAERIENERCLYDMMVKEGLVYDSDYKYRDRRGYDQQGLASVGIVKKGDK